MNKRWYTPGSTNSSLAEKWGPRMEPMYVFPIQNKGIFKPAMLVYQRLPTEKMGGKILYRGYLSEHDEYNIRIIIRGFLK